MRIFIYELISAGGLGDRVPASLRREGWAMLSCALDDFRRIPGHHVITILDESCPYATAAEHRRVRFPQEPAAFRDLAAWADATLVIAPEFDDHLAGRARAVLDAGGKLLGSAPAAIASASDKLYLARRLRECGIPTPPARLLNESTLSDLPWPCVCKPRFGAGSLHVCLFHEPPDSKCLPKVDMIAQPLASGRPVSVSFLIGQAQIISTPGATQYLSNDGRFQYLGGRTPLPAPLRERAVRLAGRAIASIPGLQGYVGVDLILGKGTDGNDDVVIEINPRLTTSYIGLRTLIRANLAQMWLRLWRGETVEPPIWSDQAIDFTADGTVCVAVSRLV